MRQGLDVVTALETTRDRMRDYESRLHSLESQVTRHASLCDDDRERFTKEIQETSIQVRGDGGSREGLAARVASLERWSGEQKDYQKWLSRTVMVPIFGFAVALIGAVLKLWAQTGGMKLP